MSNFCCELRKTRAEILKNRSILDDMGVRTKRVLILFYGLDGQFYDLAELGKKWSVTRERIRHIREKSLGYFRNQVRITSLALTETEETILVKTFKPGIVTLLKKYDLLSIKKLTNISDERLLNYPRIGHKMVRDIREHLSWLQKNFKDA